MLKEEIKNVSRFEYADGLSREMLEAALSEAIKIIEKSIPGYNNKFPGDATINNYYPTVDNNDGMAHWTTGFWTGELWLAYEFTKKDIFLKAAKAHIDSFYERIEKKQGVNHHDMGFLYIPSCVAAYKLTNDEKAKDAALMAAEHLITRYNVNGKFIQAWGNMGADEESRLIIDCMLNIPLLYWASEVSGDKRFFDIAYNHFNTAMKNIFREDGSTYHTFFFNQNTGEPLRGVTHQGYSDDSCWARGQAWGLYGIPLTNKYRVTKEAEEVYDAAFNFFCNRLPEDFIPYWDMIFTEGDMPRDSSSAAIAVCGLLEMIKYIEDENTKKLYKSVADSMMRSLIENYAVGVNDECNGLLYHSTYHYKGNLGVDACNIWGDYFYMEALTRYLKDWELYW